MLCRRGRLGGCGCFGGGGLGGWSCSWLGGWWLIWVWMLCQGMFGRVGLLVEVEGLGILMEEVEGGLCGRVSDKERVGDE